MDVEESGQVLSTVVDCWARLGFRFKWHIWEHASRLSLQLGSHQKHKLKKWKMFIQNAYRILQPSGDEYISSFKINNTAIRHRHDKLADYN